MENNNLSNRPKIKTSVSIEGLTKAKKMLDQFSENLTTDKDKAGAIKAFEFCYELSWKIMKKILSNRGVDVGSPRDVFREAAVNDFIKDPTVWFEFLKMRNRTVHTYDLEVLDDIVKIMSVFKEEISVLIEVLKKTKDTLDIGI